MLIKPLHCCLLPSLLLYLSEMFWSNLDFLWGRAFCLNTLTPLESQREWFWDGFLLCFCLMDLSAGLLYQKGQDSMAITLGTFRTQLLSIRAAAEGRAEEFPNPRISVWPCGQQTTRCSSLELGSTKSPSGFGLSTFWAALGSHLACL